MTATDVVQRYLELGLRLGRHNPEIVDAYYGPTELHARVGAESMRAPEALRDDARRLIVELDAGIEPDIAEQRRAWIRGQLVGLEVVCRKLAGDDISYVDEVRACYGVTPKRVDESEITDTQRALDLTLPGSGLIADRLAAFRDSHVIPLDRLDAVIADLLDEFRMRTMAMFGLPEGERVRFEIVNGKPWSGFNYYEGDYRSRVAVNADRKQQMSNLPGLIAHESYPGHHTEHCRKEAGLVAALGHGEQTIFLVNTPQCLMAEGLADLALHAAVGPVWGRWAQGIYADLGLRFDGERAAALADARAGLADVRQDAALMLHDEHRGVDDVVAYLQRWLLVDDTRARQMLKFLSSPLWRAYTSTYVEGYRLLRAWLDDRPAGVGLTERFGRLLDEPLIPSSLRAELPV